MTECNAASSATGTTSTSIHARANWQAVAAARGAKYGPAELMFVAAHPAYPCTAGRPDLATAYANRPFEFGPGKPLPHFGGGAFDFVPRDLHGLATQPGA